MIDIIGKKKIYFLISLGFIIPGIIALFMFGLNLSIDFTGGSRLTLLLPEPPSEQTNEQIQQVFSEENIRVGTYQTSQERVVIRTEPLTEQQSSAVVQSLQTELGEFIQEDFETIGPVIGRETSINALKAILLASFLIVVYIAWSFRKVPKPTSSWRFGITAIITLIHDVLLLLGLFAILGKFFNVEIDSLFITALLTVMGFSVHDTIVVFDRIRENLLRGGNETFSRTVNDAVLQTMTRSLNTSLTALLVLFALLLFGGDTIRWFIVALFIGIASGTYSSIFNAAPLLVVWHEISEKRKKKDH